MSDIKEIRYFDKIHEDSETSQKLSKLSIKQLYTLTPEYRTNKQTCTHIFANHIFEYR